MKWMKLLIVLLIITTTLSLPEMSDAKSSLERVIVMFHEEISEELIYEHNGMVIEMLPSINSLSAEVPKDKIEVLRKSHLIKHIERDQVISAQTYTIDWGVEKIKVANAWNLNLTGDGVKVAIIDTGVSEHQDLNIKKGVSFTSYTNSYEDDNGHGTHVAGIIAAGQNPNGLRGVAPGVELYAIKVLDQDGYGFHSNLIKGIEWAIEHSVDIINLSIGGIEGSHFLEAALEVAYKEHDILLVAAAGNNGSYQAEGTSVDFPGAYDSVIAVAATDRFDERAYFSGHGNAIELSAPGVSVLSTYLNEGYGTLQGTSMAAPHVTGMLALLKQAYPTSTNEELRFLIRDYTLDLGTPGKDSLYGYGRIEFPKDFELEVTRPEQLTIQVENESEIILNWSHELEKIFNIYRNGVNITQVNDTFTYKEKLLPGSYHYEVTAINKFGTESKKTDVLSVIIQDPNHLQTVNKYSDVKIQDWFMASLHEIQQRNIVTGYPDGTFQPNRLITRAEIAVMLGRALGLNGTERMTIFPDVNETYFASGFIQSATENGIIQGYPDQTFRPNQQVTREEMAILFSRAYLLSNAAPITFPDIKPEDYAYLSISLVVGEGLAIGYPDGTFRPKAGVTRAELVTVLARALKNKQEGQH